MTYEGDLVNIEACKAAWLPVVSFDECFFLLKFEFYQQSKQICSFERDDAMPQDHLEEGGGEGGICLRPRVNKCLGAASK